MNTDILEMLYGDGAWEISKELTEKQQRTQARVGLATNAIGITAGLAATGAAYKNLKATLPSKEIPKEAGVIGRRVAQVGKLKPIVTAGNYVKTHPTKVAAGALGLQLVNTAGDMVANRVLNRESKKVVKSMFLSGVRQTAKSVQQTAANVEGATNSASQIAGKVNSFLTPKKMAFVGGGSLTALGGATAAGNYAGSRAGAKAGVKAGMSVGPTLQAPKAAAALVTPKPVTGPTKPVSKAVKWDITFNISKADEDKRQVFGWASIVTKDGKPVADLQDDIMSIETIEKAAYEYVKKSRKGGNQHQRNGVDPMQVSDMIESFVVTDEKKKSLGLPEEFPTGWLCGFEVSDDKTWQDVKDGKLPMLSIHGSGRRTEKWIDA